MQVGSSPGHGLGLDAPAPPVPDAGCFSPPEYGGERSSQISTFPSPFIPIQEKKFGMDVLRKKLNLQEEEENTWTNQPSDLTSIQNRAFDTLHALYEVLHRPGCPLSDVELEGYGSHFCGMGAESSDLDISISVPGLTDKVEVLRVVFQYLTSLPRDQCRIEPQDFLGHTRIPLVRLRDLTTGQLIELTCGNQIAVENTRLLAAYASIHPNVTDFVIAVKRWAKSRGLVGTRDGFLSSYAWVLMCIFYLQVKWGLPNLQKGENQPLRGVNSLKGQDTFNVGFKDKDVMTEEMAGMWPEAGILVYGFLKYYSREFKSSDVISIRHGRELSCHDKSFSRLYPWYVPQDFPWINIEDPFDLTHNLFQTVRRKQGASKIHREISTAESTFHDLLKEMYMQKEAGFQKLFPSSRKYNHRAPDSNGNVSSPPPHSSNPTSVSTAPPSSKRWGGVGESPVRAQKVFRGPHPPKFAQMWVEKS